MHVETLTYNPTRGWSGHLPKWLDNPNTLLLLFAVPELLSSDNPCLTDIQANFHRSVLVGCSTAFPFANGRIAHDQAVLAVCQFEKSHLKTVMLPIESPAQSESVGRNLAECLYHPSQKLLLLFADERVLNVNEFMRGVNSVAPSPMLISGGMAGHTEIVTGDRRLMLGRQIQTHAVVAVGLYNDDGSLIVEQEEGVGMDSNSPMYEVTRAKERVLYELDGCPAVDVYREFLGELAPYMLHVAHSFPVGFYAKSDGQMHIVRSVFQIDEAAKSLIFYGDLPPDRYIRFLTGMPSGFVTSAGKTSTKVSQTVLERGIRKDMLALTLSCICRQQALRGSAGQETEAAFAALPPNTTQIGFYSSGEVAWSGSGYCELHNHTINITLIGEQ